TRGAVGFVAQRVRFGAGRAVVAVCSQRRRDLFARGALGGPSVTVDAHTSAVGISLMLAASDAAFRPRHVAGLARTLVSRGTRLLMRSATVVRIVDAGQRKRAGEQAPQNQGGKTQHVPTRGTANARGFLSWHPG